MRAAQPGSPWLLALALAAFAAAPALAQQCDYRIVTAWWDQNPDPNLIDIHFIAAVDGAPESLDPLNPSQYPMHVNIRVNGVPVILDQEMTLLKWTTPNQCTGSCQSVVCRHEEWVYKGASIVQESRCLKNAQNVCGCPTIGTPVAHEKPVPKPAGPVPIEIELVPLSLQSCTPIRPENDRYQIPYPQQGPQPVPGLPRAAVTLLALLLVSLGSMALRRHRGEAA
jgi:hypothetical protein